MVLSRVDPLGYRLMAAVLRGGGAAAGRPFHDFTSAWVPANKILLVLSLPAPNTRQQMLCTIFAPIQRPTLYMRIRIKAFRLMWIRIWIQFRIQIQT
jgi:hypothetical protein